MANTWYNDALDIFLLMRIALAHGSQRKRGHVSGDARNVIV
jgi:hypothetical protein